MTAKDAHIALEQDIMKEDGKLEGSSSVLNGDIIDSMIPNATPQTSTATENLQVVKDTTEASPSKENTVEIDSCNPEGNIENGTETLTNSESCQETAEVAESEKFAEQEKQLVDCDDVQQNEAESSNGTADESQKDDEDKPAMSLDHIKNVIDTINTGIGALKTSSQISTSQAEGAKENNTTPKEIDFDALRLRNDQLRQELMAIKKGQDSRTVVPCVTEQKIIEASKMHQLKGGTSSLETEIEIINRARKAQESLRKRQEERREAERKKLREQHPNTAPTTIETIKENIDQLKEQMEQISKFPIGDVESFDPTTIEGDEESIKEEEENVKVRNKKVHDDMLKKHLLTTVMKQNILSLTQKMNELMKERGILSAHASVKKAEKKEAAEADVVDQEETGTDDEFYIYNDEDDKDQEVPLDEEDVKKECLLEEANLNKPFEELSERQDEVDAEVDELQKKKKSVLAAAASTISEVKALIYKEDKIKTADENAESPEENASSSKQQTSNLSKSQKKKLKRRQAASNQTKPPSKSSSETTSKPTPYLENETNDKVAESTPISPARMRTFNLLLKLQRDMATMQLHVSNLQDNMRSVNTGLQEILSCEFKDM